MTKEFVAIVSGFIVVIAFLWSISKDVADIREQVGANTAATAANAAAIAELRGLLISHIAGHQHGGIADASDTISEKSE